MMMKPAKTLMLGALAALTLGAAAQTKTPAARALGGVEDVNTEVNDLTADSALQARSARPVPGSSRLGKKAPVLFLVGNSTMRTGTRGNGDNGQWGWGYFAHLWFDETRISVENHALGGTSSRTFYNDLWPDVLKGVQKGDFVLVELGHNDNGAYFDPQRARASIPGIDPDTTVVGFNEKKQRQDTVYSYGEYLRKFIRDVRAKGATPILATLTPRNSWDNDSTLTRKLQNFTPWIKAVAAEMGVSCIDLEDESARRLERFGHWKTDYMFFYVDRIHTSRFGAMNNAYSAALAIQNAPDCPLRPYLKDLTPDAVPVQRQPGKPVVFITGDSTVKNEDKNDDGMWGWGAQAALVFDTARCTVVNWAKAGRSTRTYLNEGRWDQVYNAVQPGDIVFIQFGHNDIGGINTQKERGVIATGREDHKVFRLQNGSYEAVYSFGWYLKKFIQDVREKGGTPILLSLTPRNEWPKGRIERRNDSYGKWYREVVEETGVLFIDVHNISADYLDAVGQQKAKYYFNHDHTHTSKLGAQLNARSVAQGMQAIGFWDLLRPLDVVDAQMAVTRVYLESVVDAADRSMMSGDVTTPAER